MALSYNEYYQLLQAGFRLGKENVYRFSEHDFNIQEQGVYVRPDYYRDHKETCRRFARATRKGWEWAATHPELALDIVMKYVQENHLITNRVLQKLMLEEVLRLQVDRESGKREFRLRPDMVKRASDLMLEYNLLKHEITYEQLIAK